MLSVEAFHKYFERKPAEFGYCSQCLCSPLGLQSAYQLGLDFLLQAVQHHQLEVLAQPDSFVQVSAEADKMAKARPLPDSKLHVVVVVAVVASVAAEEAQHSWVLIRVEVEQTCLQKLKVSLGQV
jgi:hypothetical protein